MLVFAALLHVARLEPSRIAQDLCVALAYVVAVILLLSRNGVDLAGIVATSAVITAVIGFSLQDTLGNMMGGVALQMERTIRAGDWIRVDDVEGRVKEIRWRQTSVETRDWDTVVIPNSLLMKGRVRVLGRRTACPFQRRQWVHFNVDFRTSPTEVIAVVEKELRREFIPNVAPEPAAHCVMSDFKESYAAFAVRYWLTDLMTADLTDSLVRTRIYSALRRAGIPLSIPAHSVFVTKDNPAHRKQKQDRELEHRLAALAKVPLFKPLTDEECRSLAGDLGSAPFVKGEAMTRQGDPAHWLYLIVEGAAEVQVTVDGATRKVANLRAGDYFGEMAMMTGQPRASTVLALTDVQCYRLGLECFRDILQRRPEIAEEISHTLARRRLELEGVREEVSAAAARERLQQTQHTLLHRLRLVFNLEGGEKKP